jgi:hypothetical protein
MTNALPLSSRIYNRLLVLYPEDLRREFGADMALVFAEDLEAARRQAGLRGAIRVWGCALGEFFRFALPGHASSSIVRVPAVWFALSTMIMSGETAMAVRHMANMPTPFHAICAALLMPSLGTPFVFLVAVWACRGGDVISLDLSYYTREEHLPCSKYAI